MFLITVDCDDVLATREYGQLTQFADAVVKARPDVYSMDVADNDTCHYPSHAGTTSAGHPMDALLAQGHDPYGIIVGILKEAGIAVVPNYRMNDHHGSPGSWTAWEREHQEWSLGRDTGAWKSFKVVGDRGWREIGDLRQMDYAIEGVRARRLAILREIVDRYPVDGLQLDFGRSAPFLSEPKREKATYMTQFVRAVRSMLDEVGKERGQHLMLAAAVPWDIAYCTQEGLDIKQWVDEGLLSYVSPGEWIYIDYNIPYSDWTALTEGSGCKVYPMLMSNVSSPAAVTEGKRIWLGGEFQEFDPPKIRALSESAYSQGVDGIMFYNMYVRSYGSSLYPQLGELSDPARIPSTTRHYFYARRLKYLPTEYYSFGLPDGYEPGEVEAFTPFPLDEVGDSFTYPFLFGSRLDGSTVAFQFKLRNLGDADEVAVRLNGRGISADDLVYLRNRQTTGPTFRYSLWQAALEPSLLKQGENVLTVTLVGRDPGRRLPVQAGEIELLVEPGGR